MRMAVAGILAAVVLMAGTMAADAASLVQWNFTGRVLSEGNPQGLDPVFDPDGVNDGSVVAGSVVSGFIRFDPAQPDTDADANIGQYRFTTHFATIRATVGNYTYTQTAPPVGGGVFDVSLARFPDTCTGIHDTVLIAASGLGASITSSADPSFSATEGALGGIVFGTLDLGLTEHVLSSPSLTTTLPGDLTGLGNDAFGSLFAGTTDAGSTFRFFWEWTSLTVAPIPEPGTLTMFGFGLAGLGWMCRRRAS